MSLNIEVFRTQGFRIKGKTGVLYEIDGVMYITLSHWGLFLRMIDKDISK